MNNLEKGGKEHSVRQLCEACLSSSSRHKDLQVKEKVFSLLDFFQNANRWRGAHCEISGWGMQEYNNTASYPDSTRAVKIKVRGEPVIC